MTNEPCNSTNGKSEKPNDSNISRRKFIAGAVAAGISNVGPKVKGQSIAENKGKRAMKIKLGVIGNGGRGNWITGLFQQDGGYEIHAVADYFQDVADACGDKYGVARNRRFSGLSGYKRLLESGVDAVALETPPYFFPEHAEAAVEAGKHVYMAKPVAVDVPGCEKIEAAAKKATAKRLCFLVDYQMETDPQNIHVVEQVHNGAIGRIIFLYSRYYGGQFSDPPLTSTIESRLQHLIWVNDTALGGGYHVNADIHAVDAGIWLSGSHVVSAEGISLKGRVNPHGDSDDVFLLNYELANGMILQHQGRSFVDMVSIPDFCSCMSHGQAGNALLGYAGVAELINSTTAFKENVVNLYEMGARRNIATFHQLIQQENYSNATVPHAVESALTTILGREAGLKRVKIILTQLKKENKRLEVNLRGLKD
jgi:myo-inositol 2-dehydrogenase/D-chiro-inositol 1-dehydrogenase